MKKYDIFLFDADGTLFDFDRAEKNALKAMFKYCGFVYSEDILLKYREISSQLWDDFEKGNITSIDLQTSRFTYLFDYIGVSYDSNQFNLRYLTELGKGTHLIDGALEICDKITTFGKKIYIVTNGILSVQKARIENSEIKKYITDYFVSEFIGFQKPQTPFFDYVFSHTSQLSKGKYLIVGDSLTADIAGGISAGIDSCWFNKPVIANNTNIAPTYEINELTEIINFI
jgi:2-haloacid dehalogenase